MPFLKNKYFLSQVFLFIVLLVLDQLSKYSALRFLTVASEGSSFGFSLQAPIKNHNLIFGFDFGLEPLLVITSITALFCLFLFYYILSLIFIPKAFYFLQTGITILFSGFASNSINKLAKAYTIDFIKWSPSESLSIYFNLADIFQTTAWLLIFLQIALLRKTLWRAKEKRNLFLMMKNYQLQFVTYCILAFVCLSVFFLLLNYQFLGLVDFTNFSNIDQISNSFFKYSVLILFFLCGFITLFFLYLSNKIYGPFYAFERYIKALLNGEKPKDLQLRKHDQLKHLENLAKDIKKSLTNSS